MALDVPSKMRTLAHFGECFRFNTPLNPSSINRWRMRKMVERLVSRQRIEPILDGIDALPDEFGDVDTLVADSGYFSAANDAACEAAGVEPLIAMGRQPDNSPVNEHFGPDPKSRENPTSMEAMAHRLKTRAGWDL